MIKSKGMKHLVTPNELVFGFMSITFRTELNNTNCRTVIKIAGSQSPDLLPVFMLRDCVFLYLNITHIELFFFYMENCTKLKARRSIAYLLFMDLLVYPQKHLSDKKLCNYWWT